MNVANAISAELQETQKPKQHAHYAPFSVQDLPCDESQPTNYFRKRNNFELKELLRGFENVVIQERQVNSYENGLTWNVCTVRR